jgi:translocation and assembly module TamB
LAFNIKGLYRGRVQGGVQIAGTALNPKLSGQLNLFNGEIQLAGAGATTGGSTSTGSGENTGGERESGAAIPVEFEGLKLTLGQDIRITQAPILSFAADGTLIVNGSLAQPRPEGTIQLKRGQVNLFTTQFRLARDYDNTAQFVRERGLDPVLDVRLTASVAEATQRRLPTDPLSAEISDAPTFGTFGLGSVQTVRVQARVQGPASRLLDPGSLELTSNPPRSEAEIVALIGGGFIDTLGRGDTTLGLANLAGSALLSNVQNAIGDALGLSEFRLSPTIIRDDNRRTSSLGLTAEAGVDISRKLSVSLLKELTTDQPFQYSLRYRLNDKTLLRGFTDLSGDAGAIVEYETRF